MCIVAIWVALGYWSLIGFNFRNEVMRAGLMIWIPGFALRFLCHKNVILIVTNGGKRAYGPRTHLFKTTGASDRAFGLPPNAWVREVKVARGSC